VKLPHIERLEEAVTRHIGKIESAVAHHIGAVEETVSRHVEKIDVPAVKRVESALTKGVGVAKAATARARGLHGVFVTLARQHGEARVLLARLQSASGPRQRELWQTARAELASHEHAEEKVLLPTLGQHARLHHLVQRHASDAETLREAVAAVDELGAGSERWKRGIDELERLVEEHARMEERELFPLATEIIAIATAEALDERFSEVQRAERDRLLRLR